MKHEITINMEVKLVVEVEYDITREWSADERGVFHAGFSPDIAGVELLRLEIPVGEQTVEFALGLAQDFVEQHFKKQVEQDCFDDLFAAWHKLES